jgi:hypothetical protein
MLVDTVWPFVLEFVLELGNERPCNATESQIPPVDTPTLVQWLILPIIVPSLSPHVILAIAESPVSTFVEIAITHSFGSI